MKLQSPLGPTLWRIAATVAACLAALAVASAQAAPVAGEYSLALVIVEDTVDVGDEFVVQTVIEPGAEPPYQAAQWEFNIHPDFSEVLSIDATEDAPSGCNLSNQTGPTVLVGCIELSGPTLTYSGAAFEVRLRCLEAGTLQFNLNDAKSFVGNAESLEQPSHLHGDTIVCGDDDTVVVPSTSTPSDPTVGEPTPGGTPPDADGTPGAVQTEEAGATRPAGTPSGSETAAGPDTGAGAGTTPLAGAGASSDGDGDDDGRPVWPWIVVGGVAAAVAAAGVGYWQIRTRAGGSAPPG